MFDKQQTSFVTIATIELKKRLTRYREILLVIALQGNYKIFKAPHLEEFSY